MTADATMPAPPPPAGFDPEAEFDNITPDTFTAVPKSSHRTAGGDRELRSIVSIGLLTLYLSNKKGWHPPNAEKLAAKYKEGAAVIRDAVKELERAGFVVRYRTQGKGGLWKTHVRVSADPTTLDAVRVWAVAHEAWLVAEAAAKRAAGLSGGGRRKVAARADAGHSGNAPTLTSNGSTFPQVGPDGTDRDSVHRDSADRHSVQGDLIGDEGLGDQEENPPRSKTDGHDAQVPEAEAGGNSEASPKNTPEPSALDLLVAELAAAGSWDTQVVREVLVTLADRGRGHAEIARVFRELAAGEHGPTGSPRRLLTWWPAAPATAAAATPAEPYRHQPAPPCPKDCRCYKHPTAVTGISDDAAAAIAAARAKLRPGKPLSRSGSRVPTQPTGNAGTAASGAMSTESAPDMADA